MKVILSIILFFTKEATISPRYNIRYELSMVIFMSLVLSLKKMLCLYKNI